MTVRTFAFEENGCIGHYIGGYSDWMQQRKETERKTAKKKNTDTRRPQRKKLKFTYNEAREFEGIEDEIAQLEEKISQTEEEMTAHAADFVKLAELSREKEEKEVQLLEKMERWEYLTNLAERIARGEFEEESGEAGGKAE